MRSLFERSRGGGARGPFVLLCAALFVFTGCGYHVAGMAKGTMPGGVTSLAIPFFVNRTQRPDIEKVITTAFIDEFVNNVEVVDREKAGAVLEGTIKTYTLKPVSFTESDVIQEYRLTITMDLRLVSTSTGEVLWEDGNVMDYEDFRVDTTDVNATKEAEKKALEKMAKDTARLVKERLIENF